MSGRASFGRNPGYPNAEWRAVVSDRIELVALAAGIAVACWLLTAWAIGRGHRWARIAFAIFFGVNLLGLLGGLVQGSATYASPDAAIGSILCLVQFAAVVLVFPGEFRKDRTTTFGGRSIRQPFESVTAS